MLEVSKLDWNYVIRLFISSGVGLALMRWVGPIVLKQVIKDIIKPDVIDVLEDHADRIAKNELGIQTQSLQMSKIESAINILQRDREMIIEIHSDVKSIRKDFNTINTSVAILQDRWDGINRRSNG